MQPSIPSELQPSIVPLLTKQVDGILDIGQAIRMSALNAVRPGCEKSGHTSFTIEVSWEAFGKSVSVSVGGMVVVTYLMTSPSNPATPES